MENDAISRSAVMEILTNNIVIHEDEVDLMEEVCHTIKVAPSLDVAPVVHASWEFVRDKDCPWITNAVCGACKTKNLSRSELSSTCLQKRYSESHKYCFMCGARMDGGTGAD